MKWSEKWELATIPDDLLFSEVGRRRAAKGAGRPRSKSRCKCGRFTKRTAKAMGHKCGPISA